MGVWPGWLAGQARPGGWWPAVVRGGASHGRFCVLGWKRPQQLLGAGRSRALLLARTAAVCTTGLPAPGRPSSSARRLLSSTASYHPVTAQCEVRSGGCGGGGRQTRHPHTVFQSRVSTMGRLCE